MPERTSLLSTLLHSLKRPTENQKQTKTFLQKLLNVIRLVAVDLTIAVIISFIISFFLNLAHYDSNQHAIVQFLEKNNALVLFLLGAIYAPITEELTFRLFLKYSPVRVAIGFSLFVSFILQVLDAYGVINIFQSLKSLTFNNDTVVTIILNVIFLIIGIVLGLIIKKANALDLKLNKVHTKFYSQLFYLSAILFGLAHITNYSGLEKIWYLIPVLGLPQVVVGLLLSYVRTRYGLGWSMLFHSIHNSVSMIPLVILSLGSDSMRQLITSSQSNSEQLTKALTSFDYLLLLFVMLYFLFILLAILIIWIQLVVEAVRKK